MNGRRPLRVRVEVPAAPVPGLLRAAIERRLAGSAFNAGPEDAVAKAVADAVAAREREGAVVTLIKGLLMSYSDPVLGLIPTIVAFQYNPTEITRTLQVDSSAGQAQAGSQPTGSALNVARPAVEDYTVKLEFDATDGLERGGPITTTMGISPRLAALEMLVQPVGSSLLGGLASALTGGLLGGGGASVPPGRLPLCLFVWGPERITPVRLKSLTIHEQAFDELLNPILATADLSFTVLRVDDLSSDQTVAIAAAKYYQGAREVKSVLQLAQIPELL